MPLLPVTQCLFSHRLQEAESASLTGNIINDALHPVINIALAGEKVFLDETTAEFLSLVEEKRSVRSACEALGTSYSTGWNMIKRMEALAGCKLVIRTQGGRVGGGRSCLTEEGKRLVRLYTDYRSAVCEAAAGLYELCRRRSVCYEEDEKTPEF